MKSPSASASCRDDRKSSGSDDNVVKFLHSLTMVMDCKL